MKTLATPLDLLDKFFKDNSKEEVEKYLSKFDTMEFEGPTLEEYSIEFQSEFETYHNENFQTLHESDYHRLWNSCESLSNEFSPISRKPIIEVTSQERQSFNKSMPNKYALAA